MSGHYHNALYTGDVEERVKILKSLGQGNKSPGAIKPSGNRNNIYFSTSSVTKKLVCFSCVASPTGLLRGK